MVAPVQTPPPEDFSALVDIAVDRVQTVLTEELDLGIGVFEFVGPHLVPKRKQQTGSQL
jgi:hypothetical protein